MPPLLPLTPARKIHNYRVSFQLKASAVFFPLCRSHSRRWSALDTVAVRRGVQCPEPYCDDLPSKRGERKKRLDNCVSSAVDSDKCAIYLENVG
jgi:hypothetical protein